MIGLDTNVLVRYVVEDDEAQTAAAAALIESGERLFVSHIVLCEVVWALAAIYEQPKPRVVEVLEGVVQANRFAVEDAASVRRALDAYANGRGDFADYIVRERARSAGCERVATFDKALLKEDGFTRL